MSSSTAGWWRYEPAETGRYWPPSPDTCQTRWRSLRSARRSRPWTRGPVNYHRGECRECSGGSDPFVRRTARDARRQGDTVKYMLLIFNRPGFVEELTEQERDQLFGEVGEI